MRPIQAFTVAAAICLASPASGDGVLLSWGPADIEGMNAERWSHAKALLPEDIRARVEVATSWAETYEALLGSLQYRDDKGFLAELATRVVLRDAGPLRGANRLIIWERVESGDILFEGKGFEVNDDLFTAAGRANWILRNLTGRDFGHVLGSSSPSEIADLQFRWFRYLSGETPCEWENPFSTPGEGLQEIQSLAALRGLISALSPSEEKSRVTHWCLERLYGLSSLPTEPGAPGRLCNPDVYTHSYLAKLTGDPEMHDQSWWRHWLADNFKVLVWNPKSAQFYVAR